MSDNDTNEFNNEVGNVAFRATFDNPHQLLRHGETGTALLTKKYHKLLKHRVFYLVIIL